MMSLRSNGVLASGVDRYILNRRD